MKHFISYQRILDLLSANPTKWSNTLKQFVVKLPTNCLSVFDHFVGLALKALRTKSGIQYTNHQMNNAIKNQLIPVTSHVYGYIHLSGLILQ